MPESMLLREEGDSFAAPLEVVWAFVSSRDRHAAAHVHEEVHRELENERSGTYAWTQRLLRRRERFVMRWRSYHPLGLAYEVLAGPFEGRYAEGATR
jgi:hypothetical protein